MINIIDSVSSAKAIASFTAMGNYCIAEFNDADAINRRLFREYANLDNGVLKRTHLFHGRYENTYIDRPRLPALEPVILAAQEAANLVLGKDDYQFGFWLNEMAPGDRTSRHNHDDHDELLSGVYYINAPANSGALRLFTAEQAICLTPAAGRMILFDPMLDHDVEQNLSQQTRLSIAFNFGPPSIRAS
ncbi:MAG: putative 2OG-Fe(II) oxygenase [bacterium]